MIRWILMPWCICGSAALLVAQDVPSENVLPKAPQQQTQIPSENELPQTKPANQDRAIPSENVLPHADTTDNQNADASSALPGGVRPWLRLAMEGHTGVVRTLGLGGRGETLFSGGEDKDLHIWRRSNFVDTKWIHQRTVRWQVNRGPRGRIYAIAASGNEVAIAGHGASGRLGEIWVVNQNSGDLIRPLVNEQDGHRQVIQSMAWSRPDNQQKPRLVSQDVEGHVMLWQSDPTTGIWSGRTIIKPDLQTYGERVTKKLRPLRGFVPVVFDTPQTILSAHFVGFNQADPPQARWHLKRTNVDSGQSVTLDSVDHLGAIVDLDVSSGGGKAISSDATGTVYCWTFGAAGTVQQTRAIKPGARTLFVDLDAEGRRLLLGTEASLKVRGVLSSRVQLWDLRAATPKFISEIYPVTHAVAGVFNPAHNEVLVASANRIAAYDIDDAGKLADAPRILRAPIGPVRRVAFATDPKGYKIAVGSERQADGSVKLDRLFDLSTVTLAGNAPIDDRQFQPPQKQARKWSVKPIRTAEGIRAQLYEGETPRGVLPLKAELHGAPSTISTITQTSNGVERAAAVVVGTTGRNNVYVYAADQSNPPKLLRQFRAHTGSVRSTSSSRDGRYLASGSEDTTVCIWNLQDIFSVSESVNRWGVQFQVDNDQLIAETVRDDGPLYFRGVRAGDRLISIAWADENGTAEAESDPTAMLARLTSLPFDALVVFNFTRLGRAQPAFQSFAAWHPLATLFVDEAREWAFWTPAGYYDASFNGHQRFGWQINRDINQLPDFFRAAQLRQALERPDLMRRLLAAGSLSRAMRETISRIGPPPGEGAIVNQYRSKPRISVLSPTPGQMIDTDTLTVTAEIEAPLGATLAPPKAFVSGIPARKVSHLQKKGRISTFSWQFGLPRDRWLQLEVLASTEAEAVDRVTMELQHRTKQLDPVSPRLHLLAIGVGDYRDPQIPSLDFAADATAAVADLFRQHASSIYQVSADQLVNGDATRALWRAYARQTAQRLAEDVSPDDLVVMYLCGHGLRDRRANQWYFVTTDADYGQLMDDQFDRCLSFADLALLSKVPCRKLAILDSCHSGAIQPVMRSDDLKSALRFLQDDLVLTFTASEGEEKAAERRETGLGRFTTYLVEALQGQADRQGDKNGVVTLPEAIDYVTNRVALESEAEQMPQHPTASPPELIRRLPLPLTVIHSRRASE